MSISPNHIAIIMDGNRRWAKKRRLEALLGHDKGAETLKDITKGCADAHINWLISQLICASAQPLVISFKVSAPLSCPKRASRRRFFAHLRLPSMIIAI